MLCQIGRNENKQKWDKNSISSVRQIAWKVKGSLKNIINYKVVHDTKKCRKVMKKENEYTFSKKQIEDIIRKTITDYFESNGIPTQLLYPNSTRVWFSYDIDNDTDRSKHERLEKVLQSFNAESWGNSVATF